MKAVKQDAYDALCDAADEQDAEKRMYAEEFTKYVKAGDLNICIHNNTTGKFVAGEFIKSPQPLHKTLFEAVECVDFSARLMRIFAGAAARGDAEAVALLKDVADKYADNKVMWF